MANVCTEALCVQRASECCKKVHPCGHPCGGVAGEEICMPCLEGCDTTITHYADADDFCQICWTESLSAAPSIRLGCGHVMHYHCGVFLLLHPPTKQTSASCCVTRCLSRFGPLTTHSSLLSVFVVLLLLLVCIVVAVALLFKTPTAKELIAHRWNGPVIRYTPKPLCQLSRQFNC
eukprot:COSAG06_NODE_10477_length_1675_cov_1.320862_2_plen_176_part_00